MIDSISTAVVDVLNNSGFTAGQVLGLTAIALGLVASVLIFRYKYKSRDK